MPKTPTPVKRRRQVPKAKRVCLICGHAFRPTRNHAITCSPSCRKRLYFEYAVMRAKMLKELTPAQRTALQRARPAKSPRPLHLPRLQTKEKSAHSV